MIGNAWMFADPETLWRLAVRRLQDGMNGALSPQLGEGDAVTDSVEGCDPPPTATLAAQNARTVKGSRRPSDAFLGSRLSHGGHPDARAREDRG
jgi:hypothetical protein